MFALLSATSALHLPSSSSVPASSRRAVLAGAGAAAFPLAARAFDLPPLDQFDDAKARKQYAKMPNPAPFKQQSSLFYTVSTGDMTTFDKMIEGGWDLAGAKDSNGKTVLHRAAQVGNAPAVAALLKAGVPVDATTYPWKETPLHMAVRNNKVETVKQLIEAGASKSLETQGGDTPLALAQKYKFKAVVEALQGGGAASSS